MADYQSRVQLLFGTPFWRLKWPDALSASLQRIAAQVETDVSSGEINPGFNRSNFLGSQSRRCMLRESPYLHDSERRALIGMLSSALPLESAFRVNCWMNCSLAASHNSAHVHPGAEISGVLYISVPPESGRIVFRDPRPQAEMSQLQSSLGNVFDSLVPRFPVSPEPGDLLLFPSWLMHQVETGRNQNGLRISMALNINGLKKA
uniref:TIGR02466 family protein n=1 Tax=Synechococcus sp. UW106 TaxID=368495 RepID=UPI000E0F6DF3|nr:TIGR02466 family protein [Synechococcus sp. UW106]